MNRFDIDDYDGETFTMYVALKHAHDHNICIDDFYEDLHIFRLNKFEVDAYKFLAWLGY